jgi:Secretion system C-terminal sorting domain
MKAIHYSFLMCAFLCLTEHIQAQTPVTWVGNTKTLRSQSPSNWFNITANAQQSPCIVGSQTIPANTNGSVKFTLRATVGSCIVGFGLGDQTNGNNQTFGNAFFMTAYNGGVVHSYYGDNSWTNILGCNNWVNGGDAVGTEIKVERIGSTLNYYHNNVLKCTKTGVPAGITLVPTIVFYDGQQGKTVSIDAEILSTSVGTGVAVPAVEYTYDETGNRVRRKTVTVVLPRASKQEEEITFSDFKLKVFPNPSDGRFEVTVEGDTEGLSFDVFDMAGKHLHKQPVAGMNTSINVSHLSTGMYILTCRDAKKIKGQWKLLIQ